MKDLLLRISSGMAWVLAAGMVWSAPAAPPPFGMPFVPRLDSEVVQEVPSRADPAVKDMLQLRAKFAAAPTNLGAALSLANSYVDYGRQIGDAHYAGYAEAVIAPWLREAAPPASVVVLQATILQFRHQFSEAREYLRAAFKIDPSNAQAWLTLATLDMVQGDYGAAAKDCAQVGSHAGFNLGLACSGNLRSYIGRAEQSAVLLQQASVAMEREPAATRAWVQGLLAESAERLGRWPEAESHYRQALSFTPQDNFLLVAYADFLLDRARPLEVLTLLEGHEQSDTAFLRIVLAQAALRSAELPNNVWIMAARFEALALRGSDFFGREQARFALQLQHDPARALDIALQNWRVQRAPWDARVVLEAALAARQPAAAAPTLEFLRQTKLQDPLLESLSQQLRAQTGQGL
jgi:tetratricopeptide (TPR) repeat protein